MQRPENGRLLFVGGGLVAGVLFIGLLSLVLDKGDFAAVLLLDWNNPQTLPLPYPLTIQNLMTIILSAALGEVTWRFRAVRSGQSAIAMRLLPEDDRTVLVATDLPEVRAKALKATDRGGAFLPRLVDQVVLHFQANRTTSQAHELLNSMLDLEMHRVDLNYAFLRYVVWLLPSLGFLGTVVGIATALIHLKGGAGGATAMDQVIGSLSTAFNTTIVGLCWSMILVFLMGRAQQQEEASVNREAAYCLKNLINRLYVPQGSEGRTA